MTVRSPLAEQLDLQPHPEGGWFRETWRSAVSVQPDNYPGQRSVATAIYFLLHPGEESHWHVVRSDELWFWHSGGPLVLRLGGAGEEPAPANELVLGRHSCRAGPGSAQAQPGRIQSSSAAWWRPALTSRTSA
jgi:uncharacterized protein